MSTLSTEIVLWHWSSVYSLYLRNHLILLACLVFYLKTCPFVSSATSIFCASNSWGSRAQLCAGPVWRRPILYVTCQPVQSVRPLPSAIACSCMWYTLARSPSLHHSCLLLRWNWESFCEIDISTDWCRGKLIKFKTTTLVIPHCVVCEMCMSLSAQFPV
jgi:hypothetical protein